jgi:hypothetical protein
LFLHLVKVTSLLAKDDSAGEQLADEIAARCTLLLGFKAASRAPIDTMEAGDEEKQEAESKVDPSSETCVCACVCLFAVLFLCDCERFLITAG